MPQLENNLMELATLVMASVDPGILSYTVAFVVVIGVSLSATLPHFEAASTVETLETTVEKTYIRYDEYKDMLGEAAGFDDKLNRFRVEVWELQERHLQARNDMSWTDLRSWRRYMRETKAIWMKARHYQREIVELRKALKLAIVRAHRAELEAAIGHHNQEREEITEGETLEGGSVV